MYPSGAAFATAAVPASPGRLSTITCWFQVLRKLFGDGAREPVRDAAGTEVHDDADRLVRKILRILRGCAAERGEQRDARE